MKNSINLFLTTIIPPSIFIIALFLIGPYENNDISPKQSLSIITVCLSLIGYLIIINFLKKNTTTKL